MKALMCRTLGPPDSLVYEEVPDPVPGPGQVLVAMKAAGVKNAKLGDRVIASCRNGAFAEKVVAQAAQLIPLPPGLSYEVGAAFSLTYGTSYHALKDRAARYMAW